VKTVAISSSGIAASGSSDESIKLFNLRKRVEIGTLLHHEGNYQLLLLTQTVWITFRFQEMERKIKGNWQTQVYLENGH